MLDLAIYLYLICILLQCSYYILFATGFIIYKKPNGAQDTPASIVIAHRNEVKNAIALLGYLKHLKHPNYEVILVDDRSSKNEFKQLLRHKSLFPQLQLIRVDTIPNQTNGKKFALEKGIKAASNQHILLTDADCKPKSSQWVNEILTGFEPEKEIVLSYSQYQKKPGLLNYFIRYETLLTGIQYLSLAILGKPYMGVGRNMAYKKELFIASNGFNGYRSLIGGDDDLFVNKHATKRNATVVIGKNAVTISKPVSSLKAFWRQKIRHLSIGKQYKTMDKILLGLFSFTNIGAWLLFFYLLFLNTNPPLILFLLGIKLAFLYFSFKVAGKKIGDNIEWWGLWLLDLIYVFYYLIIGGKALVTKKVRWK